MYFKQVFLYFDPPSGKWEKNYTNMLICYKIQNCSGKKEENYPAGYKGHIYSAESASTSCMLDLKINLPVFWLQAYRVRANSSTGSPGVQSRRRYSACVIVITMTHGQRLAWDAWKGGKKNKNNKKKTLFILFCVMAIAIQMQKTFKHL